jgi:hypothetical protein
MENGKVKDNPARLVDHRQENHARVRWPLGEEESRLRAYIQATCPQHLPELDLALHTGIVWEKCNSLIWEHVNVSRKVFTISRSKNPETRHVPLRIICAGRALKAQ